MDKIAILIPCFNEEKTIGKVVTDFKAVIPEAIVYVYNNNSSDNTSEIAEEAGATVRYEYQQGKGNVIRRMFAEIDAECYILVDGDDTYPAENAREMADIILASKADMVIGDRLSSTYFDENKRPFHGVGNRIIRKFINLMYHNEVKDVMTGYRAFSYRFVKTFPCLSRGFEIETEMCIHALDKSLRIENVVVDYRDRPEGSTSKLRTYADGFKVIRMIGRLFRCYRPAVFFGLLALLLILTAIAFLIPVLIEFSQTGLVERFPTLIVCGFIMIAGILSFFSGQILETINQKNRQDFELELLKAMERLKQRI